MDEDSPEVVGVLLDAVVQGSDLLLLEESQDALFELSRPLARDDLDERNVPSYGLVYYLAQRPVDLVAAVIDVV